MIDVDNHAQCRR